MTYGLPADPRAADLRWRTLDLEGAEMTPNTDFEHAIKNCLAIIVGYTSLLLQELPATDSRRADLIEIDKAAAAALALVKAHATLER